MILIIKRTNFGLKFFLIIFFHIFLIFFFCENGPSPTFLPIRRERIEQQIAAHQDQAGDGVGIGVNPMGPMVRQNVACGIV